MGVDHRRLPLPAPTDSTTLQTSGGSATATDLATDVSRRTDKTSYSIPEDGSPVVIPTKKRKDKRDKDHDGQLTKASHQSQTSLLIEYFEGGKGPNVHARPSVRVKVTPSAARKAKDAHEHIQITEASGARKPSYTRRISLGPRTVGEKQLTEHTDDKSISSYTSAAEDSSLAGRYPPVEIELLPRDQASDLSTASISRQPPTILPNPSEISSIPPDSMLDGPTDKARHVLPQRNQSRSPSRGAVGNLTDTLKTPSRRRSRSLSRERIAQKAIEKLGSKPSDVSSRKRSRGSKTRSRSTSVEQSVDATRSPRRRFGRHHDDDETTSGVDSSVLSNSQLSLRRRSGDQYSFRSGTSKSSLNNPKLLDAVEDAIRRLILPEFSTLKEGQKRQANRDRFEYDRRESLASGSISSRGDSIRRVSKHASAPDVSIKPKVVLNRDEHHAGTVLSGNSIKGRKGSRSKLPVDSSSEHSFEREMSEETVIRSGEGEARRTSKGGNRLHDAAVGAAAGADLTAEALKYHDSRSSIDKHERRQRRSKSHSHNTSVAGSTEEIFHKHDVLPMPMRSAINESEVTRDSILSELTDDTASSPFEIRRAEIREVSRGSPREVLSPSQRTPTRSPANLRKGLGTHHSNLSRGDLSIHSTNSNGSLQAHNRHSMVGEVESAEPTVDTELPSTADDDRKDQNQGSAIHDEQAYVRRAHAPALSPIQSVASYKEETDHPARDSLRQIHSSDSISSLGRNRYGKSPGLSIKSLTSDASTRIARSNRPKGISLEDGQEVLEQLNLRGSNLTEDDASPRHLDGDDWYEQQHEQNNRYRESYGNSSVQDSAIGDHKEAINVPDDDLDSPYLDDVTTAHEVQGIGAHPEYIRTPLAVESAVASLLDPSVISDRSKVGSKSLVEPFETRRMRSHDNLESIDDEHHELQRNAGHSPLQEKQRSPRDSKEHPSHPATNSPRQSVTQSLDDREDHISLGASGLPIADDPMPEHGYGLDSESDLNTNPSIIQGPLIGGSHHESRDQWHYQSTPPQSKGGFASSNEHSAQASLRVLSTAALAKQEQEYPHGQSRSRELSQDGDRYLPTDVDLDPNINHDFGPIQDPYMDNQSIPSPPMGKDEGYMSAPNAGYTPEPKVKHHGLYPNDGLKGLDDFTPDEDPFVGKSHRRHLSANSHGMPSPLYDSATGTGIDRIQSKDVVALMDHLTVRDAQRNARDTEILVTLVRSAAEMRNSFEDMKRFIVDQDEKLIDSGMRQHDRTIQKIIGGPRPQPLGTPRTPRRHSTEDDLMDDLPARKTGNVFRRALKGLSGRSSKDLVRIEEMLVQLLGDVEILKAAQSSRLGAGETQPTTLTSYDNLRAAGPDGYEPEGQAGTSSTGNQSGYFSNPPSRQASGMRGNDTRRGSQNRISTVLEGDEELEMQDQIALDHRLDNDKLLTPPKDYLRGGSVPLDTPPQVHIPTGAQSNEHTPKTATDKSRKHKSSNSSFFPKISRWSKTTASSAGDNFRPAGRREEQPLSEASRSGSEEQYNVADHYDAQGDDRLRSDDSLANDPDQENRPPSPLIPSQVSEKPKYQAQRDSLNLQHPQPRPGPTHRYHHQLESQAHTFGSPISPTSDQWGSNPSLARFVPGAGNRLSGGARNLSPISDAGYSNVSAAEQSAGAANRTPSVRDDGPLVPSQSSRLSAKDGKPAYASRLSSEHLAPEHRYSNGSATYEVTVNGSPRSASSSAPQRKPTGPRPITSSGNFSPDKGNASVKAHRYRGPENDEY